MSNKNCFYMITCGETRIEKIFAAKTKKKVVKKARSLINAWHEYAELTDEEIIELAEDEQLEFELVIINAELPKDPTFEQLLSLYKAQYSY